MIDILLIEILFYIIYASFDILFKVITILNVMQNEIYATRCNIFATSEVRKE